MKRILFFSLLCLFNSCFIRQERLTNGQCRPKNPNFKLLKVPFEESHKLNFDKAYLIDGSLKSFGYIFCPDGKLIFIHSKGNLEIHSEDVSGKTWDNASEVGYWRINGNEIKIEYFLCSNSGVYIKEFGKIIRDTIFLERPCGQNPIKREKCWSKYVLSEMSCK